MNLDWLLPHLESIGIWTYWIVLFFAFIESLAIVGSVIPGASVVIFAGFLASQDILDPVLLILLAILGAALGDAASYHIGTKGRHWFKNENRWLKKHHIDQGKAYFDNHGGKSVFIGRFIPILRPMVPFVAGLSHMGKWRFYFWNILSAVLWGISHVLFGYYFGNAIASVEEWSKRIVIIVLGIGFLAWFSWFATKKALS